MHEAVAEFIHEGGGKEMGLGDVEEAGVHRRIKGEVQRGRGDAGGQGAAEGFLEVAATEGQEAFGIGEEEADGKFVLTVAKFAVPIGGELVVGVFSGAADGESTGSGVTGRD